MAFAGRAKVHAAAGRDDEAIADYTRVIEIDPEYKWALIERGGIQAAAGRNDEAIADHTRAIEIDPEYKWALIERGRVHAAVGRNDEAIADHTRAIQIDPEWDLAFAGRAKVHAAAGRDDEAIADYTRAIEIDPEYDSAFGERAKVHAAAARYDEAIADHTRAIEIDPDDGWTYCEVGLCLYRQNKCDTGRQWVARASQVDAQRLSRDPSDCRLLFNSGVYALILGSADDAERWIDTAIAREPTLEELRDAVNDFHDVLRIPALSGLTGSVAELLTRLPTVDHLTR